MADQPHATTFSRHELARVPDHPGVYLFWDSHGTLLYIGKALSLRKRVGSYFRRRVLATPTIAHMVERLQRIEVRLTASEAEALLIESQLVKQLRPYYNVELRDDKAYPLLKITREPFPRLLVVRRRQADGARYFGPYTDATLMRQAIRFLRRVFPLRTCRSFPKTPCLEYHLGQCLAPCVGYVSADTYDRMVADLAAFLEGHREQLLRDLSRRMRQAARDRRFEEAARVRDQIQALTSIIVATEKSSVAGPLEQLQAALKLPRLPRRIEAFDLSNIFGDFAVGSMVVFIDGQPHKAHSRHFKIKTVEGIDDYGMMREVIHRRYSGSLATELPSPDLILVDGGKGQLAAACGELAGLGLSIPAMGLAKRLEQIFLPQARDPIVLLPTSPVLHLVQHIRDEAHRFAIRFHRQLRAKPVRQSALDEVKGIGPIRKAALLRAFGSAERIRHADARAIARAAQISHSHAESLLAQVRGASATQEESHETNRSSR